MKITPDHLARGAFIYIRQSTVDQLANNHESRLRQYGLADRARALGWTDVTVIDDDLGRSGSGVSRPGFERLLAAICEGRVGAVFAIEASRLARNGRDWHTLIEFCGLVGTVIVDEDGTYEPRHPNDRLLLGMKGTMSELELSLLRARSMEALKQKARRGELFFAVAVGYVKVGRDKIEMDPDLRVREAIGLVFTRFAEMQSIRQVFLSLRGDQIALPYINSKNSGQHQLLWKLPVYATVNNLLTNPVYAGAYAFGRTGSRVMIENGRKRILRGYRKDRSDWAVLLVDHHEGYLSWPDYERNQRLIADNANGKGMMVRGAVRKGEALLAGLLRCGHCGRRLLVSYNGTKGDVGRYNCDATGATPALIPVSRSALCGSTRRWVPRSCGCCSRSALKRRSTRSQNVSTSLARNNASSNWRLSRRGTRQPERGDSMTRSILTIVLSLASLSGGGIPPSRRYARWRRSWRRCSDSGRRP
jgi:DNA invertase Pin-like site-specific DNA recombinase